MILLIPSANCACNSWASHGTGRPRLISGSELPGDFLYFTESGRDEEISFYFGIRALMIEFGSAHPDIIILRTGMGS